MMDEDKIIENVHEYLETDEVGKAVMDCLRLSRHLKDHFNSLLFLRELYPGKHQCQQVFFEDTIELKQEAQQYIWEKTLSIWNEERTLSYSLNPNDPKAKTLVISAGVINQEIEQFEKLIQDKLLPNNMGEFDTAAFTDRYNEEKLAARVNIRARLEIRDRIKTRCLIYVSTIEKQLESQSKSLCFLTSVQNEVDNYFKTHCEDIYEKLQKASSFLDSDEKEDHSILLSTIRRAIKSVADYFYPSTREKVICSNGKERAMTDDKYVNRLLEYLSRFKKSISTDLMKAEFDYLCIFVGNLNDIASKGVHGEVSSTEAKQGFLGLYMLLYSIIQKLEKNL